MAMIYLRVRGLAFVALCAFVVGCGGVATAPPSATPIQDINARPVPSPVVSTPYPIPASCPATPLGRFERRRGYPAFWLDGVSLAAGNAAALFYTGGQKIQWQPATEYPGAMPPLLLTGERLDGPASPAAVRHAVPLHAAYSTDTYFPAAGCWRIHASVGAESLDGVIYAYPDGCLPAAMRDPSAPSAPCVPPPAP
jgi:hypothetical protein